MLDESAFTTSNKIEKLAAVNRTEKNSHKENCIDLQLHSFT